MPRLADRNFIRPDTHASRPEFHPTYLHTHSIPLASLGRRLCRPFVRAPIDAYRAIYFWVHLHIRYSIESSETEYEYQVPSVVYRTFRARCVGYSALFKALANAGGLPCIVVGGRAKKNSRRSTWHAWVLVEVEGWEWGRRFVDPTWGARGKRSIVKEEYFSMEMEEFERTHTMDSVMGVPGGSTRDLNW